MNNHALLPSSSSTFPSFPPVVPITTTKAAARRIKIISFWWWFVIGTTIIITTTSRTGCCRTPFFVTGKGSTTSTANCNPRTIEQFSNIVSSECQQQHHRRNTNNIQLQASYVSRGSINCGDALTVQQASISPKVKLVASSGGDDDENAAAATTINFNNDDYMDDGFYSDNITAFLTNNETKSIVAANDDDDVTTNMSAEVVDPDGLYTLVLVDTTKSIVDDIDDGSSVVPSLILHPILHYGAVNVPGRLLLEDGLSLDTVEGIDVFAPYQGPNPPSAAEDALFVYEFMLARQQRGRYQSPTIEKIGRYLFDYESFFIDVVGVPNFDQDVVRSSFISGLCVEEFMVLPSIIGDGATFARGANDYPYEEKEPVSIDATPQGLEIGDEEKLNEQVSSMPFEEDRIDNSGEEELGDTITTEEVVSRAYAIPSHDHRFLRSIVTAVVAASALLCLLFC